ncbi:MAG: hypothetical protein HY460_01195 [Parcubacteria group bacterium]|nr:hypothetical protein [Parcubacteria group bacterium]
MILVTVIAATPSGKQRSAHDEEETVNPLWNGIVGAGIGASVVAVFQFLMYRQQRLREKRDVMFKCFESYVKAKEYHGDAVLNNKYEDFHKYFRTLLDLQWVEFRLWTDGIIDTSMYETWLYARHNDYAAAPVTASRDGAVELISYRLVWEDLNKSKYWSTSDPFREHMSMVHDGRIDEAIRVHGRRAIW